MTDEELIARLRDDSGDWLTDAAAAQNAALRAERDALRAERDETYAYAKHLAEAIFAKGEFDAPQWKPLEDTLGVLTQIDNMVAGIRAIAALPARGVEVKDARDALEELANMPLGIPLEDWARLSARILTALAPTDAATQKGGDAHDRRLRSHEASPGVTAGADAAQAREAALREAHKAILAMDTKKDEDLTYNLAVLRAAEKVRRLIDEART